MTIAFKDCMEILTACIPGMNSIQPVNDTPATDLSESVPSGGSQFTSLLNQEVKNNGDSNISEKQELNPGSRPGPERGTDVKGKTSLCNSDDAVATDVTVNVTAPQVNESPADQASDEATGNQENLLAACLYMARKSVGDEIPDEAAVDPENPQAVCRFIAHESEEYEETDGAYHSSGKLMKSEPADGNGLKMGELLFKMFSAFLEANNEDLPDSLSAENGKCELMKATPTAPENLPSPELPAENGLKMGALLFEMLKSFSETNKTELLASLSGNNENCEVTEAKSAAPGDLPSPEMPSENGVKMGALLYEMINASMEVYKDGSRSDLMTQCNTADVKTCRAQTDIPSEHGLKAGIVLPATGSEGRQVDSIIAEDGFITGLTQNIAEETAGADTGITDTFRDASGQASGKKINHFDTVLHQEENTDPDSNGNNAISAGRRTVPVHEVLQKSAGAEGLQNTQSGPENNLKVETASESSNQINQQNISLQSGRAGDMPLSGQAARPAGFTQVLDNVVYVMKGNNKLGVSIDHDTLGKLDISLSMEKGILNVQINTSERQTREFIENNIQSIMDSLAKDGVTVGGFSVALKERKDHERNVFVPGNNSYRKEESVRTEEMNYGQRGLVNVFA